LRKTRKSRGGPGDQNKHEKDVTEKRKAALLPPSLHPAKIQTEGRRKVTAEREKVSASPLEEYKANGGSRG